MINTYEYKTRRFDQYGAFYSWENGFVSFETGEVMYTRLRPDPQERVRHYKHRVTLIGTSDDNKRKYINPLTGNVIPRAQLNYDGMQYLILDNKTGRAVGLSRSYNGLGTVTPRHLNNAAAFSLSETSGIVGRPVAVHSPVILTDEMLSWKKAVEVIAKLTSVNELYKNSGAFTTPIDELSKSPYEYVEEIKELGGFKFHSLQTNGVTLDRANNNLQYIIVV